METKAKRAPRAKKAVAATAATAATASVIGALGGEAGPALFVEEIAAAPTPPPKAAKKSAKKPPVVAAVTPDGIQGSLTAAVDTSRPIIVHLPIRSADIENDLFAQTDGAGATDTPSAYDPDDVYAKFGQGGAVAAPVAAASPAPVAAAPVRPSLPVHYSEKLMVRFQDANREQRLPDSTDVACFWDCQPFRGPPCVIPTGIEEGIWRVYGNFCCPSCAAAYLFNERLDSNVQWERYALLNRLYASGEGSVRLAPARAVLRLFGGTLEVEDYRALVAEKRLRVDVMTPPMISIVQVMDTKPIDFYDAAVKNTFIPWEMDRMNRPGAQGLRLRRTKPVAEKESTLEWCMGITA